MTTRLIGNVPMKKVCSHGNAHPNKLHWAFFNEIKGTNPCFGDLFSFFHSFIDTFGANSESKVNFVRFSVV